MKSYAKILLATALCGAFAATPLHAAPSAESVLRNLAHAEKTLSYSATETLERTGAPAVRVKVQRSGRMKRFDYLAPDVRRGDAVIDNGSTVWIYLRGENAAVQTMSRPDRQAGLRPGAKARVAGVGSIGDRMAWIVEITRDDMQRRLWVDQKNGALLKREIRRDGAVIEESLLADIKFGPVSSKAFAWTPPAGANVSRTGGTLYSNATAARRLAMLKFPSYIPRGYSFESAIVDEKKGEAWLRFSGARRFSIFQSRGESNAPLQKVNGAWFFGRGGNRFVIVGLEEAEARKLAASL